MVAGDADGGLDSRRRAARRVAVPGLLVVAGPGAGAPGGTTDVITTDSSNIDARPGFRCDECGAVDFCYVDWREKRSLCGACVERRGGFHRDPPAWTVIA
jgi:hypothetical protein